MKIINEITVFLPRTGARPPVETARELVEALNVGRAAVGEDILTGGVFVRLPYEATLHSVARTFLKERGVSYEIDLR